MGMLYLLANGITTKIGFNNFTRIFNIETIHEKSILLVTPPSYDLDEPLGLACRAAGFSEDNILIYADRNHLNKTFDYIYVTEGNTFEILGYIRAEQLINYIRDSVLLNETHYIGASAGAMIAGTDVALAMDFDRNINEVQDFKSLHLFNGTVIPHYSPSELKRYINNSEMENLRRYQKIYSVKDGKMLILPSRSL